MEIKSRKWLGLSIEKDEGYSILMVLSAGFISFFFYGYNASFNLLTGWSWLFVIRNL